MNPVNIVTIKNKIPLYKGEEEAERIELIEFEENGFRVVSQKGLYEIGNKAIYIQPDYCLSDIPLFEGFLRPGGDPKKCILGSNNRIKAKKFSFHTGNGNNVYSEGILLPFMEVSDYLRSINKQLVINISSEEDLVKITEALDIKKWEEPESGGNGKGGVSKPFPEGMYKTDEENINNLWNYIEQKLTYPISLIGTEKCDGSSISIWYKNGNYGIASRNLSKPIFIKRITGRRNKNLLERLMFWKEVDLFTYEETINDSDFVKIGYPYLQALVGYCERNNKNLVLRGELSGEGLKGSGNKNNPHSKQPKDIRFFGVDKYDETAIPLGEEEVNYTLKTLGADRVKMCFFPRIFNSRQEIEDACNEYFKTNLIEGIVLRTPLHDFSCKFMNPEYDSKK